MMKSTATLYARTSALPAIAAALALSSTPLLAQEVPQAQPVTTEPTTAAPSAPTPAPDEPATSATDSSSTSAAPDQVPAQSASATTRTVRHAAHVAAAKPAPSATKIAPRSTTTTSTRVAASTPAAAPTRTSHVNPVVDLTAKPTPAPATAAAAKPAKKKDATLPIAGGAALAFLAIGGAAVAMTRRRDEDEEVPEEAFEHEPVAQAPEPVIHEEQPAIVGPSAFAWDRAEPARAEQAQQDDRRAGESWVERAYRGPSADNPSLSLRTRLKRAAFFDKREREVAAGVAEPVDTDAGLPDAMVDEQERELA